MKASRTWYPRNDAGGLVIIGFVAYRLSAPRLGKNVGFYLADKVTAKNF
jgi:hypothetical protein